MNQETIAEREKPSRLVGIAERAKEGKRWEENKGIKWLNDTWEKVRLVAYSRVADISTTLIAAYSYGPSAEGRELPRRLMEQYGNLGGLVMAEMIGWKGVPLQLAAAYTLNKISTIRGSQIKWGNIVLLNCTIISIAQSFINSLTYYNSLEYLFTVI